MVSFPSREGFDEAQHRVFLAAVLAVGLAGDDLGGEPVDLIDSLEIAADHCRHFVVSDLIGSPSLVVGRSNAAICLNTEIGTFLLGPLQELGSPGWRVECRMVPLHALSQVFLGVSVTLAVRTSCVGCLSWTRICRSYFARRAALILRNVAGVPLEPAIEDVLNSIAIEIDVGRSDLIRMILREWLETNAYLPVRLVDEDSETDGNA